MIDRLRSGLEPLRKDDPPRAWWDVLLWMPVGFAIVRLADGALPPAGLMVLAGLLAAAHHIGPAIVASVAGAGALLVTTLTVWDGDGCQVAVGDMDVIVIVVFGSIFVVSSWVRLIGSASLREMARHLLIATATIEVALVVVRPGDVPLVDPDAVLAPVLLSAVLMAISQIALIDRRELGMLSLGSMLVLTEVIQTTHDNPCGPGGYGPLLGMVTFAAVAYYLARSRPLRPETEQSEEQQRERGPGAWVDQTPETGAWVDTSKSGVWVDGTPDTGVWLDDDYEYEFHDPEAVPREPDLTYDNDDQLSLDEPEPEPEPEPDEEPVADEPEPHEPEDGEDPS